MNQNLLTFVAELGELFKQKRLILATAESCTGGQVAQTITCIPGSSAWLERGFVTYSNQAKQEMLGVSLMVLERHGAVSAEVAREMAESALRFSHANIGLAITGIAGPEGDTPEKPVGTVWFAWAGIGFITQAEKKLFIGDRLAVRDQATEFALRGLKEFIKTPAGANLNLNV